MKIRRKGLQDSCEKLEQLGKTGTGWKRTNGKVRGETKQNTVFFNIEH